MNLLAFFGIIQSKQALVLREDEINMNTATRQVSLRLPEPLYESIKVLAKRRNTSINRLAQQELEHLAKVEFDAQLRAGYDTLSHEESEVEDFFVAQSEVVLRDE